MSVSHAHSGTTDPGIVTEQWFAGKAEPLFSRESGKRPWLLLIFGTAALTALIISSLLIHFSPARAAAKVAPQAPAAASKAPSAPIVNDVGELRARLGGMAAPAGQPARARR